MLEVVIGEPFEVFGMLIEIGYWGKDNLIYEASKNFGAEDILLREKWLLRADKVLSIGGII